LETSSARDELIHASRVAEKLLKRYTRDDRVSHFRRVGLEAALNAL